MATWEIVNTPSKRTAFVRMTGTWSEDEIRRFVNDVRMQVIEQYDGRKHILIADMRGCKTFAPAVAKVMGEYMADHRAKGIALCVHISDESVQRLQMLRIARQNSAHDDVSVDVSSMEEAHRVADEMRARLDDTRYAASIR